MFPHQQVHSPQPTPLLADPLGEERQGAGSCKERKLGVMWKDVTKDEESTMRGRTPAPRPGPSPVRVIFSLLPGDFPGDESVSFPGGLLFSSWPLPGSSLTQPRPPVLPLGSLPPHPTPCQEWALSSRGLLC